MAYKLSEDIPEFWRPMDWGKLHYEAISETGNRLGPKSSGAGSRDETDARDMSRPISIVTRSAVLAFLCPLVARHLQTR